MEKLDDIEKLAKDLEKTRKSNLDIFGNPRRANFDTSRMQFDHDYKVSNPE